MNDVTLSGSCLCGSVCYEISGTLWQFNHCHCERCRKATGTGHASNIILKPADVQWTAGAELLQHYKLPEAKRFSTTFCRNCGSPLPRVYSGTGVAVVPAGTLDTDPDVRPERRIFEGSRADWSCPGGDVPGFETYPGMT